MPKPSRLKLFLPVAALLLALATYALVATHHFTRMASHPLVRLWVISPGADALPLAAGAPAELYAESSQEAYLVVVSLGADRHVTQVLPDPQSRPPRLTGGHAAHLGQMTLGTSRGYELLLGEFCHTELQLGVVAKAAERALEVAGGPDKVKTLDLGCAEASTLLLKR